MSRSSGIVIVGAGHAGYQVAKSLRDKGYTGDVSLIDGSDYAPYQRPPLTKSFLKGETDFSDLRFADTAAYEQLGIRTYLGNAVESIERDKRTVHLVDGTSLHYEHLILATGARARTLPGVTGEGVTVLRTYEDARHVADHIQEGAQVVILGAGFIGLELASMCLHRGLQPTVIEGSPRVMGRAVSTPISEYFENFYTSQGARLLRERSIADVETREGRVIAVVDSTGERHPADLLVIGIGVEPETGLAEAAGLDTDNGISVDEYLLTSDPHISAIGDCCSYPSNYSSLPTVRLESVQNATDQARAVASRLTGSPEPYNELPWFWSDQGAKKLQITGLNHGYDEIVTRGDPEDGSFSVFMYQGGELVAVDSVDDPMVHMASRRLMMSGAQVSPAEAADESFDLQKFAREAHRLAVR